MDGTGRGRMTAANQHRVVERQQTTAHGRARCHDCDWTFGKVGAFSCAKVHTLETGHSTYIDDVCRTTFESKGAA